MYPSPMSMGVPKSAKTRMKTSMELARSVGMTRGTMIFQMRPMRLHPRLSAASFKELSRFFSAPDT